ncbi:hypothetical protein D9M71_489750 [compost metagenome]
MGGAFENVADFLDAGELLKALEIKELGAGSHHEWRMGHGTDGGHVAQQLHVRGRRAEGIVADHRRHRLSAELAEAGGVHVFVETAAGDVTGVLKVVEQLLFGHMQYIEFDVLAKIRAVHQQLQSAPGGLQLLKLGLVQDYVHLLAQDTVYLGDHLVDALLVDRLLMIVALQDFANESSHTLPGDGIAFLGRTDHRVGQQLV